jgi:hypothetical protein
MFKFFLFCLFIIVFLIIFSQLISTPPSLITTPTDCVVGKWSNCLNNKKTRTIIPATNGGLPCTEVDTIQNCSNCEVTEWTTDCSNNYRTRRIIPPINGGICTRVDTFQYCSNCEVSEWTTDCSNNFRTRTIIPATNGGTCTEIDTIQNCTNCVVTRWTDCSNNQQTRTIIPAINGGLPCTSTEETSSLIQPCSDCIVGQWTDCSNNQQTRTIIPVINGGTCTEVDTIKHCTVTNLLSSSEKIIVFKYTSDSPGLIGQTEYTFTIPKNVLADVLIVGGGGGGGFAGGGGGGGDVSFNKIMIPNGSHKVRVGKGGYGSTEQRAPGGTGYNSSLILKSGIEYTYCGGGGGGSWLSSVSEALENMYSIGGGGGGGGGGGAGVGTDGSDGGAGVLWNWLDTGISASGWGGNGGKVPIEPGGGGGATTPGADGSDDETICNGDGGYGFVSNITGTHVGYGGGGGAGGRRQSSSSQLCTPGSAFNGGGVGGRGVNSTPGKDGTGGGGGGGHTVNIYSQITGAYIRGGRGAKGGDGVVIIKYS